MILNENQINIKNDTMFLLENKYDIEEAYGMKEAKKQGLVYKGIPIIPRYTETREETDLTLELIKDNMKIIKKYDSIEDKVFKSLIKLAKEWNMDVNSSNDLKKLTKIIAIFFFRNKDGSISYEIWYDNNYDFFGNHSLIVHLLYKDGKLTFDTEIAG